MKSSRLSTPAEWARSIARETRGTGGAVALSERLYSVRADGTAYAQLLEDDWRNRVPRWSPDGRRIAFFSNRGGAYEIWSVLADGSGLVRLGSVSNASLYYPSFSPDGLRLAANNYDATRIYQLGQPDGQGSVTTLPRLACGVEAMDALHVAAAASVRAQELVATEKPIRSIHRARAIRIVTIYPSELSPPSLSP